jgi:hypothetical protein
MVNIRHPSPAMVVALVALFVALAGTAGAALTIVPLAQRALVADNAQKLQGMTAARLTENAAARPSPATTAAGLVVLKTAAWTLSPRQEGTFTTTCPAGQKAVGGGYSDPGDQSTAYQTMPTADGSGWTLTIYADSSAPGTQAGTLYAICLK